MKRLKDLSIGILIGALLFGSIPTIANSIKTFIAEEAAFPILINEKEVELENPAVVIEGRTYLPLRTLGDVLGIEVDWNSDLNRVEINKNQIKENEKAVSNMPINENEITEEYRPLIEKIIDGKSYSYEKVAEYLKFEEINGVECIDVGYIQLFLKFYNLGWDCGVNTENEVAKIFILETTSPPTQLTEQIDAIKVNNTIYITKENFDKYIVTFIMNN